MPITYDDQGMLTTEVYVSEKNCSVSNVRILNTKYDNHTHNNNSLHLKQKKIKRGTQVERMNVKERMVLFTQSFSWACFIALFLSFCYCWHFYENNPLLSWEYLFSVKLKTKHLFV